MSLLNEKNTGLLVIDCQEKLIKTIQNNKALIFQIEKLIDAFNILKVKIYYTEQNPQKLGDTLINIEKKISSKKCKKMSFSCNECTDLNKEITNNDIQNIIICGIETHICVLQTSIDYIAKGLKVIIPKDAIGSRKEIDKETGLLRLWQIGAVPSTTESLIFELCKTSERKEFKALSKIVKRELDN